MKSKLFALMLLAGGSLFAETHFSVGVGFGARPPAVVVAGRPPYPGPGYEWIDGYYAPNGGWVAGYWAAPERYYAPAQGYYGGSYYRGRDWDHDRRNDRGRGNEWREHREHGRNDHDGGRGR